MINTHCFNYCFLNQFLKLQYMFRMFLKFSVDYINLFPSHFEEKKEKPIHFSLG